MKNGFFTALGTPFDENGNFLAGSFAKQIEDQIDNGASGLLVMGSMGIEPYIRDCEYASIAKAGAEAVRGRCPVFVGVMDNSVARVIDRVRVLEGLKIDGVVATVPYYYAVTQEEACGFFGAIGKKSPFPVYIYDLPVVTKTKISIKTIEYLMSQKNIKGIKTGDIVTAKVLADITDPKDDFEIFFSNLDIFDVAYKFGIRRNLDGMFACTVPLASKMYACFEREDYQNAGNYLNGILMLRDTLVGVGVFAGFTHAMNLLGYEGIYSPDYYVKLDEGKKEKIKDCMRKCGLI